MSLLTFLKTANARELRDMVALTIVAGVANGLLVVMINTVAKHVAGNERAGLGVWLTFGAAFCVYYFCNRLALTRSTRIIETLLARLRVDIVDRLRRSELLDVDSIGRSRLYNAITQETNHLSLAFPIMVDAFQQAVLLSIALLYLLCLSPSAFAVFAFTLALSFCFYLLVNERYAATLRRLGAEQADMLNAVGDLVDGAKELRLNAARTSAFNAAFARKSLLTEELLVRAGEFWATLLMVGGVTAFVILGVIAFGFPGVVASDPLLTFELLPVLLFCVGPPARIIGYAPTFIRAKVGLDAILEIQDALTRTSSISPEEAHRHASLFTDFSTIQYAGLRFTYPAQGESEFSVGPLDLTVKRGEIIFIVGGNGSGKSTSLRLMTGLFPAATGCIKVDGKPVEGPQIAGFRELFSAVFADFHLFDRLYGLEHVEPAKVRDMIDDLGLTGKVTYNNGAFSETHLSTGQRKRLALIGALLEDRAIYVFDEWSAEQDIDYRRYFYTDVLARLRAAGKTVIAVTHDDRFFHHADRVIKLDLGTVEWEKTFTPEHAQ